jgi:hypothetical protein
MRITAIALLAAVAAASHAGTVLGIDNNAIYKIDVATGNATVAASLTGHGSGDTNALAYNPSSNTAYFQRNNDLWQVNLGTGTFTKTGFNVGDAADATFYNGAYYYGTSSALKKVDFVANTNSTFQTYNKGWGFGDIATSPTGKLYGSSGSSMFTIDMATKAYASLATGDKQLQLAFVGNGLCGIGTGNAGTATGALYSINLATGAQSGLGVVAKYNGSALAIRDAATYQAVPEPTSMAALGVGALGILKRRRAKRA